MTYTNFTAEEIASWPPLHKKCRGCQEVLPFIQFHRHKQALMGYANYCKSCRKPASKSEWANKTFEYTMLTQSRSRAKKKGLEHTLVLSDIVIPEKCPVLKMPIVLERNHPFAPSLDRKNPNLGYTPDNIVVMSKRANLLKNNMLPLEAKLLAEWLEENGTYSQIMGMERVVGSLTYTIPDGTVTSVTIFADELP